MTMTAWYHRDISRVLAEELLAKAGRDGSFLVRDSESVPGAYALCLLFQRHVHTYRILPDADGLLAVQTSQGIQVNCFRTLSDLILGYKFPHKGLVTPLQYPVGPDTHPADESSDGEDEKPVSPNGAANTAPPSGSSTPAPPPAPAPPSHTHARTHTSPTPQQILQQRLQDITTPSVCVEVVSLLSEYLRGDVCVDVESLRRGGTNLQHLQRTLISVCHGLNSEIDQSLSSLETLAKVFDHPNCPLSCPRPQNVGKTSDVNLENLLFKITCLCNLLTTLEQRVLKALQEAVVNHNLAPSQVPPTALIPAPTPVNHNTSSSQAPPTFPSPTPLPEAPPPGGRHAPPTAVHSFQVKLVRYGKMVVSVDVDSGVLLFDRKMTSVAVETVKQDRILQLVKVQGSAARVRMVVDAHHNTPRELHFDSAKKRDAFCLLLQLMKMRHSQNTEPDLISVFVGTWNMGGSAPPPSVQSWLRCCGLGRTPDESMAGLPHDVYAVGTQENQQGEKEWAEHVRASLRSVTGIDYKQVAVQSLLNIRLVVFVRAEHENSISQVNTASIKTGLGNALGSKGAVGVSFLFNGTSFGFVNCHLTSGSEKALRRNQNFLDVLRLLSLGQRHLNAFDLSLRFTHLFWCGDLNYRLDLDVQDILKHVSKREFDELTCVDQLTRERHKRKAFFTFQEERISFPPTYRYERGSRDCYLWQKYKSSGVRINVPSWCDRILWKSYPETHLVCTSYGCTDDIFTSDHSPVFATFQVGLSSPFTRAGVGGCGGGERAWVEVQRVEAIVKTSSKTKFFIEFHSTCLEDVRRSSRNDSQSCEVQGFLKLGWSSRQLPKLQPIFSDMERLRDHHLLLSIKSCDGFESYGECCVALRCLIGVGVQPFETLLTHRGEEMGSIRGRARVHVPSEHRQARQRIYEWFCVEKDEKGVTKGHLSPQMPRGSPICVPAVPHGPTPNSYTNPAYFMFEGVPMVRRKDDDAPPLVDPPAPPAPPAAPPSLIWAPGSPLQLPRVTRANAPTGKGPRRSDFTEIEIPGCLPPHVPLCDPPSQAAPHQGSSYQLFPANQPTPPPPPPSLPSPGSGPQLGQDFPLSSRVIKPGTVSEIKTSVKNLRNMYMNHSAIARETHRHSQREPIRKERPRMQLEGGRSSALGRNGSPLYPYHSTRAAPPASPRPQHEASVPWVVEKAAGPTGDNSLTALQIAKSLSEVDFQPVECSNKPRPSYRPKPQRVHDYSPVVGTAMAAGKSNLSRGMEKEVCSVSGSPVTVRDLLKQLGLQRYTLALSLHGWDDLDYFRGVTDEDLHAAGVSNPSHRRRILDNIPKIWD